MYCTNCGKNLVDADKFCSQCGRGVVGGGRPPFARAMANHKIAGVCSGLARHFELDPMVVRLFFVIGIFLHGISIPAYIILWAVMSRDDRPPYPSASTPYAA
jgi:phage shock protein PspC (stress-responsive transcriptional regulator)